jgi:plastocyanin
MTRLLLILAALVSSVMAQSPFGQTIARPNENKISMLDDCDPTDPAWDPTGGCTLKVKDGDVTFAEFFNLLVSPLSIAVVGHPSWRNEPSYVSVRSGTGVRVTNEGGRAHTFTKVENFGGGNVPVPALNLGLTMAPECDPAANPIVIAPGGRQELKDLPPGLHKFQCCIHPWMRAAIRVTPKDQKK